jgi:hypothetical protein
MQEPLAGITPPVKVTDELLLVATPPTQFVLAPPVATKPIGKLSVKGVVMVAATLLGLLKMMVRVERVPAPAVTTVGLKALPRVGGITAGFTLKVATAGPTLLPLLVVKAPIGTVLM